MDGKIHLYCGDGKGKTTAAAGLAVRALGAGMKVYFTQFFKDGSSSEIRFLKEQGGDHFHYAAYGTGKLIPGKPSESDRESAHKTLLEAGKAMASGDYDLVVLDEVVGAVNAGLISEKELFDVLKNRNMTVEIVLTGRNPSDELLKLADLVSEIKCIKHYFDSGRKAKKGIEF